MIVSAIGASSLTLDDGFKPAATLPGGLSRLGSVYMSVEGLVDPEAEKAKLNKQIAEAEAQLTKVIAKLANPAFTGKAPPEVVAQQESRRAEYQDQLARLRQLLAAFGG